MNKEKQYLTCKSVIFYGSTDEEIFAEWVKEIDCIESLDKSEDEIYLNLKKKELSRDDLYEVLSFFRRYKIDMKQLRNFLTEKTRKIYSKYKDSYYYEPLFGDE